MHRVLVIGAGKIGSLISVLLANSTDYQVTLADVDIQTPTLQKILQKTPSIQLAQIDANHPDHLINYIQKYSIESVISSLPFYCNSHVAKAAKTCNIHYFDLTEDTQTTDIISALAHNANSAFVPQCGLAPGFISIVAHDLMRHFATLDTVKMRVGALPINISNALQYTLTWSTDGLINEYGNLCQGIDHGELVKLPPLDDLEEIKIDGLTYEAFNTSGGIGSLASTYAGRVNQLTYKTIRYPGHCAKMRFLMNDLNLNQDRATLKRILENCIPKTGQDVVLVYVSVTGKKDNAFIEKNYVKKFYPRIINDMDWSAIQLTTASELCAMVDIITHHPNQAFKGLIKQEQFSLTELTNNRFGHYFL